MNPNANLNNFKQVPWVRMLSVAAGAIALAVFAPIVWLAATGGVGLLVLGGVLPSDLPRCRRYH